MHSIKSTAIYIASFPPQIQKKLKQLRTVITSAAPRTEERISYGMPQYKLNGRVLVYFAAFKDHVSIFPGPDAIKKYKKELKQFRTSKGTIQFPLHTNIPSRLVKRIVTYRAKRLIMKA